MTSNRRIGRKSALKKGQSKPGVKSLKVNCVQSEDGGEEDDDSCIDSEVSSESSMSVDRPPKSLVWKDRPKSRKAEPYQLYIGPPDWNHRPRTRLVTLRIKQTTATPQSQSRRNKRSPSQRSRWSKPCNPLCLQGGDRGDHGHMDRECQASGHIMAHHG